MVEPTETETKESLDAFADAIEQILDEAESDPEIAKNGPVHDPGPPPRRGQGDPPPGSPSAARRPQLTPALRLAPLSGGLATSRNGRGAAP